MRKALGLALFLIPPVTLIYLIAGWGGLLAVAVSLAAGSLMYLGCVLMKDDY